MSTEVSINSVNFERKTYSVIQESIDSIMKT